MFKKIKEWYKGRTILGSGIFLMDCFSGLFPVTMIVCYWIWGSNLFLAGAFGWLLSTGLARIVMGDYFTGSAQGFKEGLDFGFGCIIDNFKMEHQPINTRKIHKS